MPSGMPGVAIPLPPAHVLWLHLLPPCGRLTTGVVAVLGPSDDVKVTDGMMGTIPQARVKKTASKAV
jgi:hypothetical protein